MLPSNYFVKSPNGLKSQFGDGVGYFYYEVSTHDRDLE
jgi:hypothetical protein